MSTPYVSLKVIGMQNRGGGVLQRCIHFFFILLHCTGVKIKVKVVTLEHAAKAQRWSRGIASSFLPSTSALDGGWVVNATHWQLYPRERLGIPCIGGWVGHRTVLDGSGKSTPSPEFDPRTVQPVASRCTD